MTFVESVVDNYKNLDSIARQDLADKNEKVKNDFLNIIRESNDSGIIKTVEFIFKYTNIDYIALYEHDTFNSTYKGVYMFIPTPKKVIHLYLEYQNAKSGVSDLTFENLAIVATYGEPSAKDKVPHSISTIMCFSNNCIFKGCAEKLNNKNHVYINFMPKYKYLYNNTWLTDFKKYLSDNNSDADVAVRIFGQD